RDLPCDPGQGGRRGPRRRGPRDHGARASRRRRLPRRRRSGRPRAPADRPRREDHRPGGAGPEPARGVRSPRALMAKTPPPRVSTSRILRDLRLAARKGDRSALALAIDQMRTLAHSPRYWERYLGLLRNPLARLVDLLSIKQGERIAHQKGWKLARPAPAAAETKGRGGGKNAPAQRRP